jgi:nucleotide-binding universal stress UspA family protein
MFENKGPILAAMTFDDVSQDVLRQAHAMARYYDVELCVCHVLAEICAVRPLFPYLHMDDALQVADLEAWVRRELLKTIRATVSREAPRVSVVIEQGTVHSGILRAAEEMKAGAIVIGGKKDRESMPVLGGIAERVTRHAHCPVLLVRPSPSGKVLAATDFSNPSMPAIQAGANEAERLHSELTIIHAIDIFPVILPAVEGVAYPAIPPIANDHVKQASQRELDDCVRRFGAKGGGVLYDGEAAPAIVETAAELPAQLIVVGTHGRTGLSRLALGSVAEAVLRTSPCSVLVVRIPKDAHGHPHGNPKSNI